MSILTPWPIIGIELSPPIGFFHTLEKLEFSLVLVLFLPLLVSSYPVHIMIPYWMLRKTPRQHQPACCRCSKNVFMSVGRRLVVYVFPALFKMNKIRSDHGGQTREFMVFLDRKLDHSLAVITAFCYIAYCVFCSSAIVFLQYFLVERSGKCIEKDNYDRTTFCYNRSEHLMNCASYTATEFQEPHIHCYTIALPVGLGIALAAALAVFKVAILSITVFFKVSEWYFKLTKNPPRILSQWCCRGCSRKCANGIYSVAGSLFLLGVLPSAILYILLTYFRAGGIGIFEEMSAGPLYMYVLFYCALYIPPTLVCYPLCYMLLYLLIHCDKGEYASIAAEQRPPDPNDWDVESESSAIAEQQDEESLGAESDSINGENPEELEVEPLINESSINSTIAPRYGSVSNQLQV